MFELRAHLEQVKAALAAEVEALPANRFLNTSATDLQRYLEEKYRVDVPRLRREEMPVDDSLLDDLAP